MKAAFLLLSIFSLLFSCATGSIYIAVEEKDAITKNFSDPNLKEKHMLTESVMKEIYSRFVSLGANFVKEGLGVMPLLDEKGTRMYYLKVLVRPKELKFDVNTTDPQKRFSQVVHIYLPNYLKGIKGEDLLNFDGLTFGIYWPVRDFSQCKDYGGFIEYAHFSLPKRELLQFLAGEKGLEEVLKVSEVLVSFNLEPPKSVRIEF